MDLRAYRLGFAPTLAALVVLAFSLQGVPEPLDPVPATIEFDGESATEHARAIARRAPVSGTEGAVAAGDYVRERFEAITAGTVAEQSFEAKVEGETTELRNVLLTLPGMTDEAVVIVANRNTRGGDGAASTAAATGVLLELASELGVSGRRRTLIFASLDGASADEEGARELFSSLPEQTEVDAVLVIHQPGTAELREPHLVTSSATTRRPSLELVRTAEEALAQRGRLAAGLDGPLAQIARLALPASAGVQASLLAEGVDAVALSAAGEVPLPPGESGDEKLSTESIERIGATALALTATIDARTEPLAREPDTYVRLGDNIVPGWCLALLGIALLIAPALPIALRLAGSAGRGEQLRGAAGWVLEWMGAGLAPLALLYALALVGILPRPSSPFDPGRFSIGFGEVIALLVLAGVAATCWWALGLRRIPARPSAPTLAAVAGAAVIAAILVVWIANPFLALVLVPLAHLPLVQALARPRRLIAPALALALIPLAATILFVGSALDWGASAPWQLVLLISGGGLGLAESAGLALALATAAAVAAAAVARPRRSGG